MGGIEYSTFKIFIKELAISQLGKSIFPYAGEHMVFISRRLIVRNTNHDTVPKSYAFD